VMYYLELNRKEAIRWLKEKYKPIIDTGVDVHARTRTSLEVSLENFQKVFEATKKLGENRPWIIQVILAVFASTYLKSKNPLWLMLVGNPSSNKTTLVGLLDVADVYSLDTVTANPFSSGQREKEKPQDLLPLIDGKCLIIKEYATIFGRSDEMVKQIISDFVAIYDGKFEKHSPTRGTVRHKSNFSHVGCVTPQALDSRQKYMNMVGARFLFLRIPPLSEEDRATSMEQIMLDDEENGNADFESAKEIISSYCLGISERMQKKLDIPFLDDSAKLIKVFAELVARARGTVIMNKVSFNDEKSGEVHSHYEPVDVQMEEPFRALKQLKKMAICLAVVAGRSEVGKAEIETLRRVVLSSMHVRRADILAVFEQGDEFTAREAAEKISKNQRTVKRNFDELVALEILESGKDTNDAARQYRLREKFKVVFSKEAKSSNKEAEIIEDIDFDSIK